MQFVISQVQKKFWSEHSLRQRWFHHPFFLQVYVKKTKTLTVGKEDIELSTMKGRPIKEVKEAMVLGYNFNNKGTPQTHLTTKETETISMMANLGLSIKENNMDRIYERVQK